jgi:hypothetical protein
MRYRPIDRDPESPRLARFIPDDWRHVEKYPLRALPEEKRPRKVPVVIGVNWYSEFDAPELDGASGEHFVAKGGASALTRIRGGHCVCLEPGESDDTEARWEFYDQGAEGACVGFGWSRCMTMLNEGNRYTARWLWDRAKETDEWSETNPGDDNGTSVRAAAEMLISAGHVVWQDDHADDDASERATYAADVGEGLKAFRWAESVDEVHAVLDNPRADELGAVPFLNSWGRDYPRRVWMPDEVLAVLMKQEGEVAVPTDR